MKIVCISDTHGNNLSILKIPMGDILIHTGDFTKFGTYKEVVEFNNQIKLLTHKYKIVVAGNHDLILDDDYYHQYLTKIDIFDRNGKTPKELLSNCIYLNNESITIEGYKIYGSPYQPYFRNMAFNLTNLYENWLNIPKDTDILLTHTPPFGYGDDNFGCLELMLKIMEIKPKYNIFGHIHEGYGIYENENTIFVNSSSCNEENILTNKPITIIINE